MGPHPRGSRLMPAGSINEDFQKDARRRRRSDVDFDDSHAPQGATARSRIREATKITIVPHVKVAGYRGFR